MLTETQFSLGIIGIMVFLTIAFFTASYKWRWLTLIYKAVVLFLFLVCIITLIGLYLYK